jgi:hypothetical protein
MRGPLGRRSYAYHTTCFPNVEEVRLNTYAEGRTLLYGEGCVYHAESTISLHDTYKSGYAVRRHNCFSVVCVFLEFDDQRYLRDFMIGGKMRALYTVLTLLLHVQRMVVEARSRSMNAYQHYSSTVPFYPFKHLN